MDQLTEKLVKATHRTFEFFKILNKYGWFDKIAADVHPDEINSICDQLQAAALSVQSWCFTEEELYQISQGNLNYRSVDPFYVALPLDDMRADHPKWAECSIVVTRAGIVSDRYGDGTVGVTDEEKGILADCDSWIIFKPFGSSDSGRDDMSADIWRCVEVDDNGKLVRLLDTH